jgi:methylsterol monooxygenase
MRLALINLGIFLSCILYGSWRSYTKHKDHARQTHSTRPTRSKGFELRHNVRLISVNLFCLCLINTWGLWAFSHYMNTDFPFNFSNFSNFSGLSNMGVILTQFIVIAWLDDLVFYGWHRLLHSHPWLMRHIHGIHHRARQPYPIEFIYAHPVEWLGGAVGLFLALALIILVCGQINAYVMFAYSAFRTLREISIHTEKPAKPATASILSRWPRFFASAESHRLHHELARGNFASGFTYLDYLFGTKLEKTKKPSPKEDPSSSGVGARPLKG